MVKKKSVTRRKVKKVTSKKIPKRSSKKIQKRRVASRKTSSRRNSNINPEHIRITQRKVEKVTRSLIYSIIGFVLFAILTSVVNNITLEAVFEFGMIISGALVLLFIILEIIYYLMKRQ